MRVAMHKAWPRLLRRMNAGTVDINEDRTLVIASRIWFCLYLFEHQYDKFAVLRAYPIP